MSPWTTRAVTNAPQELVCFGPKSRAAMLTGTRRAVFHILHDAKGFYRTSGMTTRDVLGAMLRAWDKYSRFIPAAPSVDDFSDAHALARIRRALAQLRDLDVVERIEVTRERGQGQPDARGAARWRLTR